MWPADGNNIAHVVQESDDAGLAVKRVMRNAWLRITSDVRRMDVWMQNMGCRLIWECDAKLGV
jgi:hypothetical protein